MMFLQRPQPIAPQPGQESVWDYPRPAIWEPTPKQLKIVFNGVTIAETTNGKRVLETSHPPTYYFPAQDVKLELLQKNASTSTCEWKGRCYYYDLQVGDRVLKSVAWNYLEPTPPFVELKNHFAFYPRPMDGCYVDGELATPQPGNFYSGWITQDIVGPFKGEPGTMFW
jgi:uncharacterized protein (DUF427 family)